MARVLRSIVAAVAALALVIGASNVLVPVASAQTQVQGWFTGYAFGNANGAGGPVNNGDFANHNPQSCPNDPSAYWTWGSEITVVTPASIEQHTSGVRPPGSCGSFCGTQVISRVPKATTGRTSTLGATSRQPNRVTAQAAHHQACA
jgi:hypothetical protein